MNNALITICDDGTCCCLSARTSVFFISIISMGVSLIDLLLAESCDEDNCSLRYSIETGRLVLLTLFQIANTLLLGAVLMENPFLMQLYVWYTLGFVFVALLVAILEFLYRFEEESTFGLLTLVPEVAFIFVLYRCLPIVDSYRRYLVGQQTLM